VSSFVILCVNFAKLEALKLNVSLKRWYTFLLRGLRVIPVRCHLFLELLLRFHDSFWLSHILVYLLYFCPSWDRSIILKQGYGLDKKGTWKRGICVLYPAKTYQKGFIFW